MLGHKIAKLRKEKRLTQSKFAEAIHVTQGAVSQWETGRTSPDIQQISIIADFFGISVDELVSNTSAQAANTVEKQPRNLYAELVTSFEKLPDLQSQEDVLAFIRFKLMERQNKK